MHRRLGDMQSGASESARLDAYLERLACVLVSSLLRYGHVKTHRGALCAQTKVPTEDTMEVTSSFHRRLGDMQSGASESTRLDAYLTRPACVLVSSLLRYGHVRTHRCTNKGTHRRHHGGDQLIPQIVLVTCRVAHLIEHVWMQYLRDQRAPRDDAGVFKVAGGS